MPESLHLGWAGGHAKQLARVARGAPQRQLGQFTRSPYHFHLVAVRVAHPHAPAATRLVEGFDSIGAPRAG